LVQGSDAVVDPDTVMVETMNTFFAGAAVMGSFWLVLIADGALGNVFVVYWNWKSRSPPWVA
jgi:hypothetical protein